MIFTSASSIPAPRPWKAGSSRCRCTSPSRAQLRGGPEIFPGGGTREGSRNPGLKTHRCPVRSGLVRLVGCGRSPARAAILGLTFGCSAAPRNSPPGSTSTTTRQRLPRYGRRMHSWIRMKGNSSCRKSGRRVSDPGLRSFRFPHRSTFVTDRVSLRRGDVPK